MKNIVVKLLVIVVLIGLCILSIFGQELHLGKDLRGGVSMVYKVTLPEGGDSAQIITQVINVLKDRVNPNGVLDISMTQLGRDRIEVVMPLPNAEVRALAAAFQSELDTLLQRSEIPPNTVDEWLRGAAPGDFIGDPASDRGQKAAALKIAYQEQDAARQAMKEARAAGAGDGEVRRLEREVARLENRFDDLREEFLGLSLGEARVRRTLALPTTEQKKKNIDGSVVKDDDGKSVLVASQRADAIERIKADYADLAPQLEATVAAYDAYQSKRKGFDDPEDLIRLLRGAGVLQFYIAVTNTQNEGINTADLRAQLQESGPDNVISAQAKWFPINQLKQWYETPAELAALEQDPVAYFGNRDLVAGTFEGQHYLLLFTRADKSMTHDNQRSWSIKQTFPSADNFGRPAVSFTFDAGGAGLMGRLTGGNLRRPMAIVLDDEIFSAPVIQSQISANGQITGNFSQEEVDYLIRVLAAGSLQARLSPDPIAINTLGPSIGQDNLRRGYEAFVVSLIAVAIFMFAYYFFAGLVADLALIANGVIIFGVMKAIDGTFTLPGLAGIVLTIGMAVDANVLIYERIREEIIDGELDLRGSIRQGYRKALSTIIDGNITNLIVCLVLFWTATTEIKGFALTLTIGICATLFTALFVTRQIYYLYSDFFKIRTLPMLPLVFPAIHRALEPSINWIGLRKVFWTISAVLLSGSIILVSTRGVDMFDTEFRGGVSLTMNTVVLDENGDGEPDRTADGELSRLMLPQTGPEGVEERIRAIGRAVNPESATNEADRTRLLIQRELRNAAILTAGDPIFADDGTIMSSSFQVKVASPKGLDDDTTISGTVVAAIVGEFGSELDVTQPVAFAGAGDPDFTSYVFPITKDELGKNINRPQATQRVNEFLGGAAIVLDRIEPPVSVRDVEKRVDRMRNQRDFVQYSGRKVKALGLALADPSDRSKGFREVVVLVSDPYRSFKKVDSEVWYRDVAEAEWKLIGAALQQPTSLEQVSTYSSAVAGTLTAQAVVAVVLTLMGILVYIWVRFGSLRYSVAAIAALVHDVTIALGLLALSTVIGGTAIGAALLIEPFRIDLAVVAALLTIIGYSLNDTIVILDRIRENRGKLPLPTAPIVNRSINQTLSRTLLTSVTTLMAVGIMYVDGGSGIRPFTFCLLGGLVVGTYSSVAIAAPLVFMGGAGRKPQPEAAEEAGRFAELPDPSDADPEYSGAA